MKKSLILASLLSFIFICSSINPSEIDWEALKELSPQTQTDSSTGKFEFSGKIYSKLAGDNKKENQFEDLIDFRNRFFLEAKAEPFPAKRFVISGFFDYNIFSNTHREKLQYEYQIYEGYFHWTMKKLDVKLGKQKISWGKADVFNPTDRINPADYREWVVTEFWDGKIPNYLAEVDFYFGKFKISGVYVPFVESPAIYLVGSDWAVFDTSKIQLALDGLPGMEKYRNLHQLLDDLDQRLIDDINHILITSGKPSPNFINGEFGLKVDTTVKSTDFSLYYYYGWSSLPQIILPEEFYKALEDKVLNSSELLNLGLKFDSIESEFKRMSMVGADFASSIFGFGIRGEMAYYTKEILFRSDLRSFGSPVFTAILGLDRTFPHESYLNVQYLHSYAFDASGELFMLQKENQMIILYAHTYFMNQRLYLEFRGITDLNEENWFLSPQISYDLTDNMEITLGTNILEGKNGRIFGQFDKNDQTWLMLKYAF